MTRFCGLLSFVLLLSAVSAHPMMGDDIDTTISPPSAQMNIVPSLQEMDISTDEHTATTSRPSVEDADTTITQTPTTAATQLDSVMSVTTITPIESNTVLSATTPSIAGMTTIFETTTMDNKMQEPATTIHLTPVTELSATVEAVESTTHLAHVSEVSTTVQTVETNPVAITDTTTHMIPAPELSTMSHTVETNSVVPSDTPSDTITTNLPMTLPATLTTMTTTTSDHGAIEMTMPQDTGSSTGIDLASFFTGLGEPNKIDDHVEIDNVLTMSSNDDTTRMATSTDSKIDGGVKQTAPLAPVTEPPKSEETNELDNGGSGCQSISTSIAVLSLAVLYVIV